MDLCWPYLDAQLWVHSWLPLLERSWRVWKVFFMLDVQLMYHLTQPWKPVFDPANWEEVMVQYYFEVVDLYARLRVN
ncbi:hypothetical protein Tco_0565608 [Tanacetum coccineum]